MNRDKSFFFNMSPRLARTWANNDQQWDVNWINNYFAKQHPSEKTTKSMMIAINWKMKNMLNQTKYIMFE